MAFENLNALLAVIATIVSVSFPFILRYLSKKDTQQEKTSVEIEERLDNYEERFRLGRNSHCQKREESQW